jgi:hypothetical protein
MLAHSVDHTESDTAPVHHPDHGNVDPKTPAQQTSSVPTDGRENTPAKWGIGWHCPAMMVGPVICGALLAVGHHLYCPALCN